VSLFSQENTKNSPIIYIYLITGGLGSILMFLLVRQSLPFNQQKSQEYYQKIQIAKQEVFHLEKDILKSQYHLSQPNDSLNSQLNNTQKSIEELKAVPKIFNQSQSNLLNSQLEAQEILLISQIDLIRQFQNNKVSLNKSCQSILEPNKRFNTNSTQLNISREYSYLIDNLLANVILLCYDENDAAALDLKNQVKELEVILQEKNLNSYFLSKQSIEQVKKIINNYQENNKISHQIKLSTLEQKLIEYENIYFNSINDLQSQINLSRFFGYLLLLATIILVSYKIINNLTKTNRNIVKVLEGFTHELETKVEQRTALLEESIQNTEAALAEAQNANKAKSRFLANMSHELRTPLNAILGFTQLMCRDSSVSKENQENIQIINRSGEHLLKLINDILEMSKIEVGQITLNEVKFDLYIMLKSIEEMLRLKAEVKQINLTFNIAKNVPKYIYTDEGKLRQIIINLLGNALKFTEKGSIALTVKLKENTSIEVTNIDFLFDDTHLLHFAVQDTGPGISLDEMDRLFSPFEQTKIGRNSNEGTGLGLSICQKFVELMGGKLEVESVVGKGSVFFFGILIKLPEVNTFQALDNQEIVETLRVTGIAPNQPQYRILAVDDVLPNRLLIKKMLTQIGFAVEEAGDGQQAIELWSSWNPDLILMDMRMPVMDGYEATRQIKSLPKGKETIIIALTASAFEEEKVVILSAGCDDFMRKPFYEAELVKKIGQYLNIDYLYEETKDASSKQPLSPAELSAANLAVMSQEWRSQLYDAAARVDNQEILQLLSDIPPEYESLAKGLEDLVEHFRCDKIIELTKSVN
jgi:signal transduction histidine kinase/CheY-like chemotaxis protein